MYNVIVELALEPSDRHYSPIAVTNEFCEIRIVTGELAAPLLAEYPSSVTWIEAHYIFEWLPAIFAVF